MKVLLLSCTKADQIKVKTEQFQKIVSALDHSGIIGLFHFFQTKRELINMLQKEQPDIVFSTDYYTRDDFYNRLNIHKILDDLQVPYIGSNPKALELVLSKTELKKKWILQDIPTPSFFTVRKSGSQVLGLENLIQATDYPYILKPDHEGNSRGLDANSIVFDQISLQSKLRELLEIYDEIIIEKYLGMYSDMREFTVAMIGNGQRKLLMPARIILKKKKNLRIITTTDKEDHLTQAIQVSNKTLSKRLIKISEKAFETAGVSDYSRCDIILANKQLFAIEINGQPMIPDKWFEECAKGVQLNTNQYISAIVLSGLVRNSRKRKKNLQVPPLLREFLPTKVFRKLTVI
ncbi:MAG: hypothetical protein AB2L18_01745 [Anaerolineaceae bacterium]